MVGKTFTLTAGSTQDINPTTLGLSAGSEFDIHNIYFDNVVQVSTYDGTTLVPFYSSAGGGSVEGACYHCNASQYIRITNTGSSTLHTSFDGVQTQ